MSQTSMRVRMRRSGVEMDEPGGLEQVISRGGRSLYVVTIIAKYVYDDTATGQELRRLIVSCIPNGLLQERYNPNASVGIWLAGRNAPTRGEDFRVRLSYRLWRIKAHGAYKKSRCPKRTRVPRKRRNQAVRSGHSLLR